MKTNPAPELPEVEKDPETRAHRITANQHWRLHGAHTELARRAKPDSKTHDEHAKLAALHLGACRCAHAAADGTPAERKAALRSRDALMRAIEAGVQRLRILNPAALPATVTRATPVAARWRALSQGGKETPLQKARVMFFRPAPKPRTGINLSNLIAEIDRAEHRPDSRAGVLLKSTAAELWAHGRAGAFAGATA